MLKIEKKIVSASVSKEKESLKPQERKHSGEWIMPSLTYKIKSRFTSHNIYCHIVDDEGGMFALFFNCKDAALEARLKGLSVTISAVLRRTQDPSFLIEELKSIEGPGGYLHPPRAWQEKGWYCGSIEAEVGDLIDWHLHRREQSDSVAAIAVTDDPTDGSLPLSQETITGITCPECRQPTLLKLAGCTECPCGYSRCS